MQVIRAFFAPLIASATIRRDAQHTDGTNTDEVGNAHLIDRLVEATDGMCLVWCDKLHALTLW
jgi:hypothetical protein